ASRGSVFSRNGCPCDHEPDVTFTVYAPGPAFGPPPRPPPPPHMTMRGGIVNGDSRRALHVARFNPGRALSAGAPTNPNPPRPPPPPPPRPPRPRPCALVSGGIAEGGCMRSSAGCAVAV